MESKLKRRRIPKKKEGSDVPDRLSCLPDSLLTHILSFLDTKTAIRTSVLSKRYKLLWTLLQCLDFKLRSTPLDGFGCCYDSYIPRLGNSMALSFQSYVNRVLQLREHSNLTSFRLSMHNSESNGFVKNCVDYAAKHKVQHLKIRIYVKDTSLVLPKVLITSSSLISLNLHNAICKSIELPKSVALPNLKEMRLKKFEFCNINFSGEIFTGCPSLETLVLSKCWIKPGDQLKIFDVTCPNLLRLEIECWRSPWRCVDEHAINVNAPKLTFFRLQGHLARVNFVQSLLNLNEVYVLMSYPSACATANGIERKKKNAEFCVNLFRQIRSTKSLSISLEAVEILSALPDLRLHMDFIFENLKYIKITSEKRCAEDTMCINKVDVSPSATISGLLSSDTTEIISSLPDLRLHTDEKLKYITIKAENGYGENTTCINKVDKRPSATISRFLSSDTIKERKISPQSSKFKHHNKFAKPVMVVPATFLQFLMESSPSAKLLTVELPKGLSQKRRSWDK